MQNYKLISIFSLRVLISALFVFSAVSKMFSFGIFLNVDGFEKLLVSLNMASTQTAGMLARLIIGYELFLGLAFLQSNYLKRFIIPATTLLLLAFCTHLSYLIFTQGNKGNCGCMGDLIPMLPSQALIKNGITLILLGVLFYMSREKAKNHIYPLVVLFLASTLAVFAFTVECANCALDDLFKTPNPPAIIDTVKSPTDTLKTLPDTSKKSPVAAVIQPKPTTPIGTPLVITPVQDTAKPVAPVTPPPPRVTSEFSVFRNFTNGTVNLDEGKKIVCIFNSDCEHCMEAAKALCNMQKKSPLPPVYILFMDESNNIPNFFAKSGCNFPYYVFPNISLFFSSLGKANAPPRVVYLHEGNKIADIHDYGEQFPVGRLEEALKK